MKRFLPILLLTGFSSPVMADITHKLSSSIQLQVNAAATQVERIGSSYSVITQSLEMVLIQQMVQLLTQCLLAQSHQVLCHQARLLQHRMFQAQVSLKVSLKAIIKTYIQGDAVSQSAPSVGQVSNFSDQVSTAHQELHSWLRSCLEQSPQQEL